METAQRHVGLVAVVGELDAILQEGAVGSLGDADEGIDAVEVDAVLADVSLKPFLAAESDQLTNWAVRAA